MNCRCLFLSLSLIASLFFTVNPETSAEEDPPKKTIYFSAITLYHPIVMYQKYQPLMNYLTENTSYRFELRLSEDYRDIINFLKTDKAQVALLGGVTYLEAKKEFNIIPILKPLGANGKPFYRCVFVTREANKDINKLSDLKGKSVAFASRLSTSGNLAPLYHLYSVAGVKLEDLSRYENFRYHDSVAREVLRGNFDAGAVIDSVAERFNDRGLKVIDVSEPIPGLPIVVRADASRKLIYSIEKALLSLDYNNPEHYRIMEQWDEEFKYGFTEASDSDYDSIRKMIDYLRKKGVLIP
ncbi:MAG: phosphate/phosphite/phosphonate ABC transporter substrate-binding protein [Nitrospiraceae bacterium]|nr:MAG: phosphate/phosphite/phosphonate ABC transporter substrate-binding protein [Nitrospiraceae bacterium]